MPIKSIARSYKENLNINFDLTLKFASFTKGHAYSYQVLGHLLFTSNKKDIDKEIINRFDHTLFNDVYSVTYLNLTETNKNIVNLIGKEGLIKLEDINNKLKLATNIFNTHI